MALDPLITPPEYKGRIHKAFIRNFPQYSTIDYINGKFTDELVQCLFAMFMSGYQAHPSFNHGGVHFIAKETDTGLEISEKPVFHINYTRAVAEKTRLESTYGATFHIFSALASSDGIREKLKTEFAARNVKRNLKNKPEVKAYPSTIKAGTKGVYVQAPDNHQPFTMVEDAAPDAEFIQVVFDSLPLEKIAAPIKLSDVVFMRKSK